MMIDEKRIEKIKQARKLLKEARLGCTVPQTESFLRDADMTLHALLWSLGEISSLRPELE